MPNKTPINRIINWLMRLFRLRKKIKIGVYGPPNTGKTTLANKIISDFLGYSDWVVSDIPHETRIIQSKREIQIKSDNNTLIIDLFDMPGIIHKDILTDRHYYTFLEHGIGKAEAKRRLHEAIKGVVKSVKFAEKLDCALVVLDSRDDPYLKVNAIILGLLESNDVKPIVVANKIDLPGADPEMVKEAFSKYPFVHMSAKNGQNIDKLYSLIIKTMG